MEIHLLDVGTVKYGDCILITEGQQSILIDGGHPGDSSRITLQLKQLLKKEPPFEIDLLIVTHCHSDHIGCLPNLVKLGDLKPKRALLADPDLGFAEQAQDGADDSPQANFLKGFRTALAEEDHSDMPDDELEQFLFDAARLSDKYREMIDALPKVKFYKGIEDGFSDLENDFSAFGLKILGPTRTHLKKCADLLSASGGGGEGDGLSTLSDTVSPKALVNTYREIIRSSADAPDLEDRVGPGAAKNDQSIVVSVGGAAHGWKALLTGDMQFAVPEVSGLDSIMSSLFQKVLNAGAFDFIKLAHHSSYNGLDEDILKAWLDQETSLFAHSGGKNDPTHPDKGVLDLLKANKDKLSYARTDHNGLITVSKEGSQVQMAISKGDFNDFRLNPRTDMAEPELAGGGAGAGVVPGAGAAAGGGSGVGTVAGVSGPVGKSSEISTQTGAVSGASTVAGTDKVEVHTVVPHRSTRVTITIDVDPEKKKADDGNGIQLKAPTLSNDATGRLSGLVFVTSGEVLAKNIGTAEAAAVLQWIKAQQGTRFVDLPAGIDVAAARASVLPSLSGAKGVVLVGGYDVVPAQVLDILTAAQRQQLNKDGFDNMDSDNFVVWSDDTYADLDGDSLPELPLSRIPDGRSSEMLLQALQSKPFTKTSGFGLRNSARPFAIDVYGQMPGTLAPLEACEKITPDQLQSGTMTGAVYLMLHGSNSDGTRFWGEEEGGSMLEAMNVGNIPAAAPGTVVFSGCCWGALTVLPIAARMLPQQVLRPRSPEQSVGLSFLRSGANAFVGCTGSHYSPGKKPFNYYGQPMHNHFWTAIKAGQSPASALFSARQQYAREIPHGRNDSFSQAVELKIFRQYTCLGLGW
jgi:beta-lactamase superfamily II metal-dependent hydrolase